MPRKRTELGRLTNAAKRRREARKKLKQKLLNEMKEIDYVYHSHALLNHRIDMKHEMNIGHYLQRVANLDSLSTRKGKTLCLSEGKQDFFGFSKNVTYTDIVPVIKTEILDPSEQYQELILPDYPQHSTTIDPMCVVETEVLDSSETSLKPLLSNIKVEYTEIDDSVDKQSRIENFSESNINYEIENSLISKCKSTQCFVLLSDCLIPENLASISAHYKSLKINKDISVQLFTLSDSPFFGHISETYKKLAFSVGYKKMVSFEKKKKSRLYSRVCPNKTRKKRGCTDKLKSKSKYICNCFKTPDHEIITIKSEFHVNDSASTQQLCSCLTSDFTMKPAETQIKEISLFDPDFGKISCCLNKMDYNF